MQELLTSKRMVTSAVLVTSSTNAILEARASRVFPAVERWRKRTDHDEAAPLYLLTCTCLRQVKNKQLTAIKLVQGKS